MVNLMLNEEKNRLVNLISIRRKMSNRLLEVGNKELQTEILIKCQESALVIGDSFEKCVYEYDIEDLTIIIMLLQCIRLTFQKN